MSHLVGERVTIRTRSGGGTDWDGNLLPSKIVDKHVDRAVVIPVRAGRLDMDNQLDASVEGFTVLLPAAYDVQEGAEIIVRGEVYEVAHPPFTHRSAFGSKLGGTEIYVELRDTQAADSDEADGGYDDWSWG